jgi:hypothetical protein
MPFEVLAHHAVDFWLCGEDLPLPTNRVTLRKDGGIQLTLDEKHNTAGVIRLRHHLQQRLGRLGMHEHLLEHSIYLHKTMPIGATAHQAGTVRFGTDPATSALDPSLQGARAGQPLRGGHQLLPEHRRREPVAHRDRERVAGRRPHPRADLVTSGGRTVTDRVDALVIFGATGILAKLETFPALVGLVDRGVLDVPVIGSRRAAGSCAVQAYAEASLRLNGMNPDEDAAVRMLGPARLRGRRPRRRRDVPGRGREGCARAAGLFYLEVPQRCSAASPAASVRLVWPAGHGSWWEKPFGPTCSARRVSTRRCTRSSSRRRSTGSTTGWASIQWRRSSSGGSPLDPGAAVQPDVRGEHPDHDGRGVRRRRPGPFYDRAGAVRDVLQNHLLQVLATATAERRPGPACPPGGRPRTSWSRG